MRSIRGLHARIGFRIAAGIGLAIAIASEPALAQTKEEIKRAEAWFAEGAAVDGKGDCATAIQKFQQVLTVKQTPQVVLRIGVCQEKLGQFVEAKASYK